MPAYAKFPEQGDYWCNASRIVHNITIADNVLQHGMQGGRVQVDGQREFTQVGLCPERDGWQGDHRCASAVGVLANALAHFVRFENVRAVGQVQIMGFRRPQRDHRDVVSLLFDITVVGFGQDPGSNFVHPVLSKSNCQIRIGRLQPGYARSCQPAARQVDAGQTFKLDQVRDCRIGDLCAGQIQTG